MCTVRCSGCPGEGVSAQGRVCVSAHGGVCPGGCLPRGCTPCEQNDWQTGVETLLFATTVAEGKNVSVDEKKWGGGLKVSRVQLNFYRPQRSCSQGNIFAPVCHSVHRGWGGLPQYMLGYPPRKHTPGKYIPPGSRLQYTVNERPVRILLECILVLVIG